MNTTYAETTENAYAKINLGLDIVGKRSDGYHLLRMVMQTLELHDTVTIRKMEPEHGIKTVTDVSWVKDDKDNLAYRAALLLKEKYGLEEGMEIRIEKKIPAAAGLAGGSSDAAAVLRGVNRLFSLGLDKDELKKLGVSLGADVPYCIEGGTKLSEGIGELLTPVKSKIKGCPVLLIKPERGISTKEAYGEYDRNQSEIHPDTEAIVSAIEEGNLPRLGRLLRNVLEKTALKKLPEIGEIKDFLLYKRLRGVLMSGSGPTVFAFDEDRELITAVYEEGKKKFRGYDVILTEFFEPLN